MDKRLCIWKYESIDGFKRDKQQIYRCTHLCYGYGVYFDKRELLYRDCSYYEPIIEFERKYKRKIRL